VEGNKRNSQLNQHPRRRATSAANGLTLVSIALGSRSRSSSRV